MMGFEPCTFRFTVNHYNHFTRQLPGKAYGGLLFIYHSLAFKAQAKFRVTTVSIWSYVTRLHSPES